MPILTINTNVKASEVPSDFKSKATDLVAKSLSKPSSYIAVHVNPGQDISFGGSDEPAALCDLISIGSLSVESNKKHSKAIMEFLESALKVKSSRTYISFKNEDKANVGFQKTTFHDLL